MMGKRRRRSSASEECAMRITLSHSPKKSLKLLSEFPMLGNETELRPEHPENIYWVLSNHERIKGFAFVEYLEFDTGFFGKKSGKIRKLYCESEEQYDYFLKKIIAELKRQRYRFISFKCPAQDVRLLNTLEKYRFRVMTAYILLENCRLKNINDPRARNDSDLIVREAVERDMERLKRITAQCFDKNTRFHNDRGIDRKKSDELHMVWIENLFKNPEKKIMVCEKETGISGYIAFGRNRKKSSEEATRAKIDLVAVAKDSRGGGVGHKLLSTFYHAVKNKAAIAEAGTEITNTAALNMYFRAGFSIKETYYSLHLHLGV